MHIFHKYAIALMIGGSMLANAATAAQSSTGNQYTGYGSYGNASASASDSGSSDIKSYGTTGSYGTVGEPNETTPTSEPDEPEEPNAPDDGDDSNTETDSGDAQGVVSFELENNAGQKQSNVPVTIGQVFRKGSVPSGKSLDARIDGQRIPIQVDKKATWQDGSLRHAVISVRVPTLPDGTSRVDLVLAKPSSRGSAPTINELLGTDFDASAELEIKGRTYQIDARELLTQINQTGGCTSWGRQCKQWLSGPVASEWIVGGPVSTAQSGPSSLAAVYFHIRAYGDDNGAISRARVDVVIENDWAYAKGPQNIKYAADLSVGQQKFEIKSLKHYRQARWHKVLWWHDEPNVYARVDTRYLQSTGAISRYADLAPSNKFLNSVATSFTPMTNGDQTKRMGNTGAQPAIGPLPRWTSTYVVSGDQRAFNWMRANDDAVGTYGFHYRDQETGRPLEITRHPQVTIANYGSSSQSGDRQTQADLLPKCGGDCKSPYTFDIAHHPSIGYVPYLVTGDYYYLEEMQFTASYIELWANQSYRGFDKGVLAGAQGQVRGQAWSLRSISDAAFATPDDDPVKSYFRGLITNILADYRDSFLTEDSADGLHILDTYGAAIYSLNGRARVGIAPWQADFFTWAVGHVSEQGFTGAAPFLKWLATFQIGRMTDWKDDPDEGYCWLEASAYSLQIRDSQSSSTYATLRQAYKKSFPNIYGLKCNSQPMVNELSSGVHRYVRGEMVGYANSATGFTANFQPALSMAVDSGVDNASEAWSIFTGRTVKPTFDTYPNFAIVPRSK